MKRRCKSLLLQVFFLACCQSGIAGAADDADPRMDAAIRTVQQRQDTDPADAANYLAAEVVSAAADPARRAAIEQRLIQGLAGAQTRAGRDFFCRQLVMIGSEAAVPELAKLLTSRESSHIARYALARIPGLAADAALLDALGAADEQIKIGLVNSLGTRNCRQAVAPIAALVASANEELAAAALGALGRIDSEAAVAAVASARGSVPARLQTAATDAYLDCAARLVRQGQREPALAIYRQLFANDQPPLYRVAALNGMIAAQRGQAVSLVIAALEDADAEVRRVAVPALRNVPGTEATRAIVAELARHDDAVRAQLLGVLADRGDAAARPAVVQAAQDASPPVRLAALSALAALGDASVVPLLAQRAAAAEESGEQQAARNSLRLLTAEGVDGAIAGQLSADQAGVRAEAARALAARGATDQVAPLLAAAADAEPAVAAEAFKALRALAKPPHVPDLVRLLTGTRDSGVRGEAENAVVAAAATAAENPAQAVLAALPGAASAEVRASLLRVLGRIAHASALPVLYQAVQDAEASVQDAAIRALAEWPSGEPAAVLAGLAADESATQVHRVLALRGYVNMIPQQPEASDDQILDNYARAIQLAVRNEEKQLVLSRLALVRHRRALQMVRQQAGEAALKQAAESAAASIEKLLSAPARVMASHNPDKAGNAIDKDPNTRWDTGGVQQGGEWFRIELDEDCLIRGLVLDTRGSGGDYPRGYEIFVSPSSLGDGTLVLKGQGSEAVTKIVFPQPVRGRAIKIVQTGRAEGLFWSIHELTIDAEPVQQ